MSDSPEDKVRCTFFTSENDVEAAMDVFKAFPLEDFLAATSKDTERPWEFSVVILRGRVQSLRDKLAEMGVVLDQDIQVSLFEKAPSQ